MQHRALPTLLKANPKGLHISKLLRGGRKILNGNIPPCRERSDKMFHLCNLKGGVEICLQAWRWVSLSSKTRTRGRKRHWAGFCWYMFLVAHACRTEEFLHYCMAFQKTWCWLHSLCSLCSHQNSGTLCLVLTAQLPLGAKSPGTPEVPNASELRLCWEDGWLCSVRPSVQDVGHSNTSPAVPDSCLVSGTHYLSRYQGVLEGQERTVLLTHLLTLI